MKASCYIREVQRVHGMVYIKSNSDVKCCFSKLLRFPIRSALESCVLGFLKHVGGFSAKIGEFFVLVQKGRGEYSVGEC